MLQFILSNWIEFTGALLAVAYLFLSINGNIWLWFLGFATSSFYLIIFYNNQLYADMGLQFYYIIVSVYGWIHWMGKGKNNKKIQTSISTITLTKLNWLLALSSVLVLQITLYLILKYTPSLLDIPEASYPLGDAFTTAASIVATWMLARKILENWLFWIVINSFSMGMYIIKGMYITSGLFVVYTLMAVVGYYKWRRELSVINK